MKLVYIFGPYRNETVSGIVANIRRAEAAAVEARRLASSENEKCKSIGGSREV
jgi:hypothetical protein